MLGKLAGVKALTSAIRFLLYSNLFIGACAVALIFTNQLTAGLPVTFNATCAFVFAATVFTYSALKFRGAESSEQLTAHHHWANQNKALSRFVMWLGALSAGGLFFFMERSAQLITIGLGLFTLFYGFVELPLPAGRRTLREFGLAKTFFVAFVWSVTTVLIPLAAVSGIFTASHAGLLVFLLIRRFLFVAALTMVFDIKDIPADREAKLYTLPMAIGISGTKLLAGLFLALLVVINTSQYFLLSGSSVANMIAINVSIALSLIGIIQVNEETGDNWYYLVLDGMMFTQFLLVLAAYHLWP